MSKTTVTKIMGLTKWALMSYLAVLTLTVGIEPPAVYAGENGKECAEVVFEIGPPELAPQIVMIPEFDKEKLFEEAVMSIDLGNAPFNVNGFEVGMFDTDGPVDENAYATEEDLGVDGLDAEVSEYEADTLKAGDILKAVPSIATKDEKTLGILVPPFAYFSKKF